MGYRRPIGALMCAAATAAAGVSQAATLEVPAQYATLAEAVSAAVGGDTVLVSPGTYAVALLRFSGKAIHLKSAAGPERTILRGDGRNPLFVLDGAETRSAIIEGFTVTGGFRRNGGAVLVRGASPTIRGNVVTANTALGGGGIQVVGTPADPLIEDNTFTDNTAQVDGAAIHVDGATADIVGNLFTGNRALGDAGLNQGNGGAVTVTRNAGDPVVIAANTFSNNTATFAGGAISVFASNVTIFDNVIVDNHSELFAGGIHLETQAAFGDRRFVVRGNRLEGNSGTDKGGAIHAFMENTASAVDILDNVIVDNRCVDPACGSPGGNCCQGGGIGNFDGTGLMTVTGNVIRGNLADRGGAAVFSRMPLVFSGNDVTDNRAVQAEPGVESVDNAGPVFSGNIFAGNAIVDASAHAESFSAGALRVQRPSGTGARIENNCFAGNSGRQAGALTVDSSSAADASVTGNLFSRNASSVAAGGAIWFQVSGSIDDNTFLGHAGNAIRIKRPQGTELLLAVTANRFAGNAGLLLLDPPDAFADVATLNAAVYASLNLDSISVLFGDGFEADAASGCGAAAWR